MITFLEINDKSIIQAKESNSNIVELCYDDFYELFPYLDLIRNCLNCSQIGKILIRDDYESCFKNKELYIRLVLDGKFELNIELIDSGVFCILVRNDEGISLTNNQSVFKYLFNFSTFSFLGDRYYDRDEDGDRIIFPNITRDELPFINNILANDPHYEGMFLTERGICSNKGGRSLSVNSMGTGYKILINILHTLFNILPYVERLVIIKDEFDPYLDCQLRKKVYELFKDSNVTLIRRKNLFLN